MSEKLTKGDLIDTVYEQTGYERRVVQTVVDTLIATFKETLKGGSVIEIRGFGTFEPRLRQGRTNARNPKTGETLFVKPHYIAAFRAGQDLKQGLWELPVPQDKTKR